MSKFILGINGSPRKNGNTDFLLKVALDEAAQRPGIRTEAVYLRDYEINPCIGCFSCCSESAARGDKACMYFRDGMDELYPKLKECDALIIATPVYFGSMTSQTKAFMDRTEGLLRYGTSNYQNALRNKIGASIAVGANRNGGQEFTIQAIHYYYFIHDMIVVGTGPDLTPGCYLGGCGTNSPQRGRIKDACQSDELGIKSCKIIGRRVAELLLAR
jgi:multimeric flavodoxin WrbA